MELKRYVLLGNKTIIDMENLRSDWSNGKDFTIENEILYQHTSKKVKPFELTGHGEGGFVDRLPNKKMLGKIQKNKRQHS